MPQTIVLSVEELEETAHIGRVVMVTANLTITGGAVFICDATAGAIALTLPAAGALEDVTGKADGRILIIKKKDSSVNAITVTRAGSDTIDGATTYVLSAQYDSVMIVDDSDNDSWNIISTV